MYEFTYRRAKSSEDAVAQHGEADDARYLAGGMSLLPTLKLRLDQASDLVDLGHVNDMRGITEDNGCIVIKGATPHAVVNASSLVQQKIPALAKLAGSIGDPLVRNRGTIGGSLANNDPSADYPSGTLGLGATLHTDRRTIAADDFFKGLFETALDEGELITQVSFPIPECAGYGRFANPASRFPLVGVFIAKTASGSRVAVTGAGPSVFRVIEMETALSKSFALESLAEITVPAEGLNADIHATANYRAHLITVLARRAIEEALV